MADMALVRNASTVASMNMLAVIISGYLCFTVLGLKPSTYYKKTSQEDQIYCTDGSFGLQFALLLQWLIHRIRAMKTIFQKPAPRGCQQVFGDKLLQTNIDGSKFVFYVVGEVNKTEFRQKYS